MKKLILFGNNSFTNLVRYYIENETDNKVAGYFVDREYLAGDSFCHQPIVAMDEMTHRFPPDQYEIILSIGYRNMNLLRNRIYAIVKEKGYDVASYISPTASVVTQIIGEGCLIFDHVKIGPFSKIGIGNIIRSGVNISHDCFMGDFNYVSPSACIAGNVKIGNNSFFGANCTIKNSLTIGDYSLVGAGCFLASNTNEKEVYVAPRAVRLEKTSFDIQI